MIWWRLRWRSNLDGRVRVFFFNFGVEEEGGWIMDGCGEWTCGVMMMCPTRIFIRWFDDVF